jgi:hypothetical protein
MRISTKEFKMDMRRQVIELVHDVSYDFTSPISGRVQPAYDDPQEVVEYVE